MTSQFSGIVGVGETWGYAMGFYMLNQRYGTKQEPGTDPKKRWFKPKKTKKLFDDKDTYRAPTHRDKDAQCARC